MDDEHEVGGNGADGTDEAADAGSTAEDVAASRRLEPVRPWLLQGAKATAQPPAIADLPSAPDTPGGAEERLRPLDPPRPWLKQQQPTAPPPKSPPVKPPNGPQAAGNRSRVLDPTRPWLVQKLELPETPGAKITPTPSNPVVLQPLVREIEAAANGQGGRRRIFGRRKGSQQSLAGGARHAVTPGVPSWPIAFESDELAASALRSLGGAASEQKPPAAAVPENLAQAGRLRGAAQWLFERAPEPVDGPVDEPSADQPQDDVETISGVHDQPSAVDAAVDPAATQVTPGIDLIRRLSAPGIEAAAAEVDDEEGVAGARRGLFRRRRPAPPADKPALAPAPPSLPMRPTIAWDELRTAQAVEPAEQEPSIEQEPLPADAPLPGPPLEPEPEPEPPALAEPEATAADVEPESGAPEPEAADPEPAAAQLVRPRPRPRPYASAPRLEQDSPTRSGTVAPEPRVLVRSASLAAGDRSPSGTDQPAKPVKGGPDRTRKNLRWLVRTAIMLLIAVIAAVLLRVFVVAPYYIPSASMEPTLHGCTGCNNDHVLVDKLSYRMHDIHRGDVVVFNRPSTWQVSEKTLIKRVVGLPGDTLKVSNGKLFVNGLEIEEPYVNSKCPPMSTLAESPAKAAKTFGPIPDDEVYVMGDNRCDSIDSRAFGPVPDSKVIGRAFVIIWPLGRIHYL